jgi:hypothetical protein
MNMDRITVKAFRAVDDRERCVRYLMEHTRVLEDIGVSTVIKPDISWCIDPDVMVVVAEHETLGMVSGIRLHTARTAKVLPMQLAVVDFDPAIVDELAILRQGGVGEVAGLWNAHRFAGRGVPSLLFEAVVSIASQLKLGALVTFVAEYVAPYASQCGFVMMEELRDGGNYVYPVPSIRTHAMVMRDPLTLSAAKATNRQRIMGLRIRPARERMERPKRTVLGVRYALVLDPALAQYYDEVDRWCRDRAA